MAKSMRKLFTELVVNCETFAREVEARRTLVDFLREDFQQTGTHLGCERCASGACTFIGDAVLDAAKILQDDLVAAKDQRDAWADDC